LEALAVVVANFAMKFFSKFILDGAFVLLQLLSFSVYFSTIEDLSMKFESRAFERALSTLLNLIEEVRWIGLYSFLVLKNPPFISFVIFEKL